MQQVFDYAIDPSRRRSRNGKKIGRPRNKGRQHHVEHVRRPEVSPRHPVHVTLRLRPGLPSLRYDAEFAAIVRALSEAKGRFGMGVTDFSVLADHLHLIVELDPGAHDAPGKDLPPDRAAKLVLARGVQGLKVRVARALNGVWKRKGSVFGDRYHAEAKTNPTTVARAKTYVLENARKHGAWIAPCADVYSSAAWSAPLLSGGAAFRQSSGVLPVLAICGSAVPVVAPRTWLGTMGWRRAKDPSTDRDVAPPPHRRAAPRRTAAASLFPLRC